MFCLKLVENIQFIWHQYWNLLKTILGKKFEAILGGKNLMWESEVVMTLETYLKEECNVLLKTTVVVHFLQHKSKYDFENNHFNIYLVTTNL